MAVLSEKDPRILGGRDALAGGTWLALNERGVFAGLTNVPGARDPSKRSRGELPLILARRRSAQEAVAAFEECVSPADFSPAWLFAGDRSDLYFIDLASGGARAGVTRLSPGLYVLENAPLFSPSRKVDLVITALKNIESARGEAVVARLADVLRSHDIPEPASTPASASAFVRPAETYAPCVHAGPYGTRSSLIALIGENAASPLRLLSSDGPPCSAPYIDATHLWAP